MAKLDRKSTHVLIVDDDSHARFSLKVSLLKEGFGDVQSSGSVAAARDHLKHRKMNVALVDCDVSGKDGGIKFVRWVRDEKNCPDPTLPVILTVPSGDSNVIRRAVEARVNNFIVKPINLKGLLARLDHACANRGAFVSREVLSKLERRKRKNRRSGVERRQNKSGDYEGKEQRAGVYRRKGDRRNGLVEERTGAVAPEEKTEKKKAPSPQAREKRLEKPASEPEKKAAPAREKRPEKPASEAEKKAAPAHGKRPEKPASEAEKKATPAHGKRPEEFEKEVKKDDGATAIMPEKAPEEPRIDLPKILRDHQTWLESSGKEGGKAFLAREDLQGADLRHAALANANLRGADLADATLASVNLEWADMRGAYLSGVNATGANFHGAKLRRVDFSLARLDGANLRDTDLAGANFKGASLKDADLTNANLLDAVLNGVNLEEVSGLTQTQFDKALADSSTKTPSGVRFRRKDE